MIADVSGAVATHSELHPGFAMHHARRNFPQMPRGRSCVKLPFRSAWVVTGVELNVVEAVLFVVQLDDGEEFVWLQGRPAKFARGSPPNGKENQIESDIVSNL